MKRGNEQTDKAVVGVVHLSVEWIRQAIPSPAVPAALLLSSSPMTRFQSLSRASCIEWCRFSSTVVAHKTHASFR